MIKTFSFPNSGALCEPIYIDEEVIGCNVSGIEYLCENCTLVERCPARSPDSGLLADTKQT